MMKKNGFTLAEVLITLAIIGVVAVLTLPALMTNTQEQRAKTALKKGINTLTEAAQMNASIAGFDYSSITSEATNDADTQSLYGLLANRAAVDFQTSDKASKTKQKSYQGKDEDALSAENYVVFFRDGSSLIFNPAKTTAGSTVVGDKKVGTPMDDGLPYGIPAIYDTNGAQGPNILSYCVGEKGTLNPLGAATDINTDDLSVACPKKGRLIKDQFGVRLRGYYAVPNGAAARWAFTN